jgi:hypothetical protein
MIDMTQPVATRADGTITSVATCACGALFFASERIADQQRVVYASGVTGPLVCSKCDTSATDHSGYFNEEGRCDECDMRSYRHR